MAEYVRKLRTKKRVNQKIGEGITFNVVSVWKTGKPIDSEIKKALEDQFGKGASDFSAFDSAKYDILA